MNGVNREENLAHVPKLQAVLNHVFLDEEEH